MKDWLHTASTASIQRNALKIALLVGCLLNLINQGTAILHLDLEAISIGKLLLTFCVPYCVSVYSATQAKRSA